MSLLKSGGTTLAMIPAHLTRGESLVNDAAATRNRHIATHANNGNGTKRTG